MSALTRYAITHDFSDFWKGLVDVNFQMMQTCQKCSVYSGLHCPHKKVQNVWWLRRPGCRSISDNPALIYTNVKSPTGRSAIKYEITPDFIVLSMGYATFSRTWRKFVRWIVFSPNKKGPHKLCLTAHLALVNLFPFVGFSEILCHQEFIDIRVTKCWI